MLLAVVTVLVVLINRLIIANDQCVSYEFEAPFFPGISCEDIYNKNPQSRDMSGYYWITDGLRNVYCGMNYTGLSCEDIYYNNPETNNKNGYYPINNNQWTFCNMSAITAGYFTFSCAGVGGEWRRIASLNISAGDECPTGWSKSSHNGISFCRSPSDNPGCYSTTFSTMMSYTRVCGRIRGYQKGSTDQFIRQKTNDNNNINAVYVDGLSITHGSPRQHIWTYVAGLTGHGNRRDDCPCASTLGQAPPSLVGSNYYCESGAGNDYNVEIYYLSDPLWDGNGCSSGNTCCSNINLPWFQYQLSQMTEDDIEVRICRDEDFDNEGILIDILELYIQ